VQVGHGRKTFVAEYGPASVIKVCAADIPESRRLLHEAEMYSVVAPLQGVTVPRLMRAGHLDGVRFTPWRKQDAAKPTRQGRPWVEASGRTL
jgi:hypothetical protein